MLKFLQSTATWPAAADLFIIYISICISICTNDKIYVLFGYLGTFRGFFSLLYIHLYNCQICTTIVC